MNVASISVLCLAMLVALASSAGHAQAPAATPDAGRPPTVAPPTPAPMPASKPVSAGTGSAGERATPPPERPAASNAAAPAVAARMLASDTRPHALSPWSMVVNADIVVQTVMGGLAFASLVTWTVLLAKSAELAAARRSLRASLKQIGMVRSLHEAQSLVGRRRNVLATFIAAATLEAKLSREADANHDDGVKERVASAFAEITRTESRRARLGLGLLATIGSTAPFVGLFGTVWGIMNSFIGISKSQTTNLAVVAPGIAEALLATAIGLVAAIPAVIIYNHFSRQTRAYLDIVAKASGAAGRLLSRDLDRMRGRPLAQAAE